MDIPTTDDSGDAVDVPPRLSDKPDASSSRAVRAFDTFSSQHVPSPTFCQPRPQHTQTAHPSQPPHKLAGLASTTVPLSFENTASYHYHPQQHAYQASHVLHTKLDNHHGSTGNTTSGSDSQETTSSGDTTTSNSTDIDQPFTPPISEGGLSAYGGGGGNNTSNDSGGKYDHESEYESQESHLLQLSRLAAASERMTGKTVSDVALDISAQPRKRAADGTVKHMRNASSESPTPIGGHSRNTSTVSIASTAGSRIGELSAELKTRLSYAMVKVNHGWQSHSIDQVESFASKAASPTSTPSTVYGHRVSSSSPRIPGFPSHSDQPSQASTTPLASTTGAPGGCGSETLWTSQQMSHSYQNTPPLPSPLVPPRNGFSATPVRSLAPPASIHPAAPDGMARRNSTSSYSGPVGIPATFSHHTSPHTPSYHRPFGQQTPSADLILFSPDQNVREQDAIETLLFMSSPGNSANMKHFSSFTSASQPLPSSLQSSHQLAPSSTSTPQRHALPTSPRKAVVSSHLNAQPSSPHSQAGRRGGHHRNASDMDPDYPYGMPHVRSSKITPRRRFNEAYANGDATSPRMKVSLSTPSGLSVSSKSRPVLGEEDIDKLLDRAAAADDSSDSDSEIIIPARRAEHIGI